MSMFRMTIVVIVMVCLAISTAEAKPKSKVKGDKAQDAASQSSAGDKVANELADAITQPLSGEETSAKGEKSMPPGLAKKDKTPPGWDKGKKTGWDKSKEQGHQDSVIDKAVKAVFGGGK